MAHRGRKNALEPFLTAIACGATIDTAADKAGIGRTTAYRWLQDPDVQQRLANLKAETIRRSADMLTAASLESIKTLLELQKANVPPAVRLGAARAVIELGAKLRQGVDLEERLLALERQLRAQESP